MQDFNLYEMDEHRLEAILKLDEEHFAIYIGQIINKFYPETLPGTPEFIVLLIGYKASFEAERLYRTNTFIHKGFRVVYTKTGLIRNFINEIYFNEDDLILH